MGRIGARRFRSETECDGISGTNIIAVSAIQAFCLFPEILFIRDGCSLPEFPATTPVFRASFADGAPKQGKSGENTKQCA